MNIIHLMIFMRDRIIHKITLCYSSKSNILSKPPVTEPLVA